MSVEHPFEPGQQMVDARVQLDGTAFEEFLNHPAIDGRLFYTLPQQLLYYLRKEVKIQDIDPGMYRLERTLSFLSGDHSTRVGYWDGKAIRYHLLFRRDDMVRRTMAQLGAHSIDTPDWKRLWPRLKQNLEEGEKKLKAMHANAAGYCGWLITNSQFIAEHDAFFQKWRDQIVEFGLPRPGPMPESIIEDGPLEDVHQLKGAVVQYCREFRQLLDRWRLTDIQSPYLPQPIQPQAPVLLPTSASFRLERGGALIHIPDIAPPPDRDSLREIVEAASMRNNADEHLSEWREIVSADNQGKRRIERFARLFQLRHCWQILHHRWGQRLKRKAGRVQHAVAAFLLPTKEPAIAVDTIKKDLGIISNRLGGADWPTRPSALDLL